MGERRQRYTKEFKAQAVELLNTSGKTGYQIEEELGVKRGVIYKWRKQLENEGERAFPGNGNERDEELTKLQRENAELREEKEILRKAIAIFSDKNHR